MSSTFTTKLRIVDWAEMAIEEFDDGSKITRAQVQLRDGADGLRAGSFNMLAYYRADGTSEYATLLRLSGQLDGRAGTFVLRGEGTYDGTKSSAHMDIVPGSGSGELAGISGTCASDSTHDDYPYMPLVLTYQFG